MFFLIVSSVVSSTKWAHLHITSCCHPCHLAHRKVNFKTAELFLFLPNLALRLWASSLPLIQNVLFETSGTLQSTSCLGDSRMAPWRSSQPAVVVRAEGHLLSCQQSLFSGAGPLRSEQGENEGKTLCWSMVVTSAPDHDLHTCAPSRNTLVTAHTTRLQFPLFSPQTWLLRRALPFFSHEHFSTFKKIAEQLLKPVPWRVCSH